jgi:hypothetical protein
MMDETLHSITERLENLEKQNRKLRLGLIVILLAAAAIMLMGQASVPRTVEAQQFVLKDAKGKTRAQLYLTDTGPKFHLYASDGKIRAVVGATEDGGSLVLADSQATTKLLLATTNVDDIPEVYSQSEGIHMFVTPSGPSILVSDDKKYKTQLGVSSLVTEKTGESHKTSAASVVLFDREGKVIGRIP